MTYPWMKQLGNIADDEARIAWIRDDNNASDIQDSELPDPVDELKSLFDIRGNYRKALCYIGIRFYQKQRIEETLTCFDKAIELEEDKDELSAMIRFHMGVILRSEYREDEALQMFEQAIPLLRKHGKLLNVAGTYQNIASILIERNQLDDAEKHLNEAIELFKEVGDNTGLAMSLSDFGAINWVRGQAADALKYHLQALEKATDSSNPSLRANIHNRIGLCYYRFSEFEKALTQHLSALRIQEKHNMRTSCAFSLNHIGAIHRNLNNYEKAHECYQQSLQIYLDLNYHMGIGMVNNNLGLVYQDQGNYMEALKYFLKSHEIKTRFDLQNNIPLTLENIAICYAQTGEYETAYSYYMQAYERYCQSPGQISCIGCLIGIGELHSFQYRESGDPAIYEKALDCLGKVNEGLSGRNEKDIRSLELQRREIELTLYQTHADNLIQQCRYEEAAKLLPKIKSLFDSILKIRDEIFDDRRRIRIMDMQMLYDMEKKEAEAKIALQEAEIMRLKNVELEEMNQQLLSSRNEVVKLERHNSILAMAVTANHEISQPLMVIRGNLDMLEDYLKGSELAETAAKYIERIDVSLEKIREILRKFRTVNEVTFEPYSDRTNMVVFNKSRD